MATRYLTVASLKLWMRSEITTADDTFLDAAIQDAETALDNACGRRFEIASSSTARVYIPTGTNLLYIHDCTAIASVVDNGSTLTSGTDYQKEPLNGINDAGAVVPYYSLRRLLTKWYDFLGGQATITVTATWGWAAIPPQILEACKIIAKDIFNQRLSEVGFGLVGITETAGGVGTRENAIVLKAIRDYAHPNSIGVA